MTGVERRDVLLMGPGPTEIGGMATVVSQLLALDFDGRYRVHHLPITVSTDDNEPVVRKLFRHAAHLQKTRSLLRRLRPAMVHLHTCSGYSFFRSAVDLFLSRRAGARVVLHIHGAAFDEFCRGAGAVARRRITATLTRADRVVALSAGWARQLRDVAPRARVVVIENAVEVPNRPPPRPRNDRCRFVFLGRMDSWKGVADLLEAALRLKAAGVAFELTLAGPSGTAGDAGSLDAKVRSLGLADIVHYVGPVQGAVKEELLASADAYVQPSHHEGMPISLLEAMAWGLPVVATTVGAVPEIVRDLHEGLLVPPNAPDLLADAMHRLAADPIRCETMSHAARRLIRSRFTLTRFEQDVTALYDTVLSAAATRPDSARPVRALIATP